MPSITKVMFVFAVILSSLLYWATANFCKYNYALEKKSQLLNIITQEIDPSIPKTKIYYYQELNCTPVYLEWDYERVIDNLNAVSVFIYQELSTDIRGDPNK
jgi:hypothetical protein